MEYWNMLSPHLSLSKMFQKGEQPKEIRNGHQLNMKHPTNRKRLIPTEHGLNEVYA